MSIRSFRARFAVVTTSQESAYSFQFYSDEQCTTVPPAPYDAPVDDNAPSLFCRGYTADYFLGFTWHGPRDKFQICAANTWQACLDNNLDALSNAQNAYCNTQVDLGACVPLPGTTSTWMRIFTETGCSTT